MSACGQLTRPGNFEKTSTMIYSKAQGAELTAVLAEWSKTMKSQIQVGNTVVQVPGSNLALDYDVDCSELEITCCYSEQQGTR